MHQRQKSENRHGERGSAIIYIFAAVSLMALLIFAVTKSGTERSPKAIEVARIESQLREWVNTVRAEMMECILTYPDPVDLDADGDIDCTDNQNPPYPLSVAGQAYATGMAAMQCPGAPTGQKSMFTGKNGRFVPTVPNLATAYFGYGNDSTGVVLAQLYYVGSPIQAEIIEAMLRVANGSDTDYIFFFGSPFLRITFKAASTATNCSEL